MSLRFARVLFLYVFLAGHTVGAQVHAAEPCISAVKERRALEILGQVVERNILSAADAMPADKYGFAPTDGEFKSVRTFGRQLKHLAATNYILAAAALGTDPPADAGDEAGPDSVVSKPQVIAYTKGSFAELRRALERAGEPGPATRTSPISPLQGDRETVLTLAAEALIHAADHYGQMVEYLRMNGIIPPASRP